MAHGSIVFRSGAAFAALGMLLTSTVHAAPSSMSSIDPLVSLSVFGTSSSRAAVCAAGAAAAAGVAATAAATVAQPGPGAGCVLPILGQAPPPPVVGTAPVGIVEPVAVAGGPGIVGLLPLFAVLGLAALAIFLLENDEDPGPPPLSPV